MCLCTNVLSEKDDTLQKSQVKLNTSRTRTRPPHKNSMLAHLTRPPQPHVYKEQASKSDQSQSRFLVRSLNDTAARPCFLNKSTPPCGRGSSVGISQLFQINKIIPVQINLINQFDRESSIAWLRTLEVWN